MVFRPVRERPLDEVLAAVDAVVRDTGFEEISFLSLSSSDYSRISELVGEVVARHGDEKLSIGLPSLRIESFSVELMDKLEQGRRRSGFTFAPEAATDRLRDVINKPIATETLLDAAREVYRRGWTTIKLYFMIGHPTQTLEDVQAIADLAHAGARKVGFQELGSKSSVRVGVSTLVPKPHTPFQWAPLADETTIWEQIRLLNASCAGRASSFRGTTRARRCSRPRLAGATGGWRTSSSAPGSSAPRSTAGAISSRPRSGRRHSPTSASIPSGTRREASI